MVTFLSSIGFEPQQIRKSDYWYLSPLRNENDASFKINRKLNRWYDFALGQGGNLVDFGVLYFECTIGELLARFRDFAFETYLETPGTNETTQAASPICINEITCLSSIALLQYLKERRIPYEVAAKYCNEIRFSIGAKNYYSIGFKNDLGGYELRSKFFKLSSSPKAITTLKSGHTTLNVFEGFFDFLSFASLVDKYGFPATDYLVLNSTAFMEKTLPLMEEYDYINLFLNNDGTGQNCSRMAIQRSGKFADQSALYKHYNDLNEWLCYPGLHDQ